MKKILIVLMIMQGCGISKKSTKQSEQTKSEINELVTFNDTTKTLTITQTEYIHFYDTITKKVYVYPKFKTERKTENKAISGTKNLEAKQTIKQAKNSVDKRKISVLENPKVWLFFAGFIILLVIAWKIGKKFRLL